MHSAPESSTTTARRRRIRSIASGPRSSSTASRWAIRATGSRGSDPVPLPSPVAELAHHRLEGMTLSSELIAHPDAVAGLYLAAHQAGPLELLEATGEEAIRHPGHRVLELREMERAIGEGV